MVQYSSINLKLSNSQFNKLKAAIKYETDFVLRLSSNMIGDSDDKIDFSYELLLINRQDANLLRKDFSNNSSTDINLPKTQLSKMIQSEGFFCRLLDSVTKNWIAINEKCN